MFFLIVFLFCSFSSQPQPSLFCFVLCLNSFLSCPLPSMCVCLCVPSEVVFLFHAPRPTVCCQTPTANQDLCPKFLTTDQPFILCAHLCVCVCVWNWFKLCTVPVPVLYCEFPEPLNWPKHNGVTVRVNGIRFQRHTWLKCRWEEYRMVGNRGGKNSRTVRICQETGWLWN